MLRQIQMRANLQVQLLKSTMGFSEFLNQNIGVEERKAFFHIESHNKLKKTFLNSFDLKL